MSNPKQLDLFPQTTPPASAAQGRAPGSRARPLPGEPREKHKAYAERWGYGWDPCAVCGNRFGQHELIDRRSRVSITVSTTSDVQGRVICPDCHDQIAKWYSDGTSLRYNPETKNVTVVADSDDVPF